MHGYEGSKRYLYALPDARAMKQLRQRLDMLIDQAAAISVPALQERLADWRKCLRDKDRLLQGQVLAGLVLLNNWAAGIEGEADAALREQQWVRMRSGLEDRYGGVLQAIDELEAFDMPDTATHARNLIQQRDRQLASVTTVTARIETLHQQRDELVEVIRVFDVPSVRSVIKGVIPSEEEIEVIFKAIAHPALDLGLLKAAARMLQANIDLLDGGRRFNDLLQARDRLDRRISDYRRQLEREQEQVRQLGEEIAALAHVDSLEGLRGEWLVQAHKLQQAWSSQLQHLATLTELAEAEQALRMLRDYLLAVRRGYEKA